LGYRRGVPVNHERVQRVQRVQRVMRALLAPPSRRRPLGVAEGLATEAAIYPNLRAGLVPTAPDQLWTAEMTYVRGVAERCLGLLEADGRDGLER
jgi:hypothetical protein